MFSIFLNPAHPHGPFTCTDPSEGQTAFHRTAFLMGTDSLGQSVLLACLDLITINNSLPVITHERQLSVLTSQISLKINLVTEPEVSQIRPINGSQLTPKMSPDVDSCTPSPPPTPSSSPQGTTGNIWRHFWCHSGRERFLLALRIIQPQRPKMSMVLSLRNPELDHFSSCLA